MSTPNPLVPQGSLPPSQGKGKSNIRLVILGVAAVHAVFIVGLLVQGCNKPQPPAPQPEANPLPPISADTNTTFFPPPAPATSGPVVGGPSVPTPSNQGSVGAAPVPAPGMAPVVAEPPTPAPESAAPAVGGREYVVVKGDSFSSIAKKSGTTAAAITKANPGVDSSKLKIGQKLVLPEASTAPAAAAKSGSAAAPAAKDSAASAANGSYTVKTGDTLTKIAKSHKMTVAALRAANGLKTDRIHVGQKLKVTGGAADAAPAPVVEPAPAAAPVPVPAPAVPVPAPAPAKK